MRSSFLAIIELEDTITISDIAAALTFLTVLIGGVFALYQWRKKLKFKRAEYLNELSTKVRNDEILSEVVTYFDYNKPWYNEKFHGNRAIEKKIDAILSYFSYICYLKTERLISNSEFRFFKYEIERIIRSYQTKSYLYNLYHFSRKNNVEMSFIYLFKYAEEQKEIDKDFYDRRSQKYPHYLNF